jgi:ribosomal protein S18 acetylase RimI-like enzyme
MYVIPEDRYEMLASYLSPRPEETYLTCQALRGKRGKIIEARADKENSPDAVLVRLRKGARHPTGMEICIAAWSDAAGEKLLESLDREPTAFVLQRKSLSATLSKWYNMGEDIGHYYYHICRGELRKRMLWPTLQLGPEHESIVNRFQDLEGHPGELLAAYKGSINRSSFATFAVIQMSEVLSYCYIGEGLVWDIFTREDKRRLGLGQSVLSAAVEWGLEYEEEVRYSARKSNIASQATCRSVGFKPFFEVFGYCAYPLRVGNNVPIRLCHNIPGQQQ